VTASRRSQLMIMASEKSANDYARLADRVDGDAYYWSSVDPDLDRNFRTKLSGMGQAIHDRGGMWIAPAAAGFDARLIGGSRNVDRKDGDTLRIELAAANAASPDVIGLISWNEFSENSFVEPSQNLGTHYLDVLTGILNPAAAQTAGPPSPAAPADPASP
jgi:hypothetical protein